MLRQDALASAAMSANRGVVVRFRRQTRDGDRNSKQDQEDAERGRQKARPHMHERAGAIGRAFERDAKAQQKHQAASVKIALSDQLAEVVCKPLCILPAAFSAGFRFASTFLTPLT